MNAAENLSEEACELKDAMLPRYTKDKLEKLVAALKVFATKPPHITFERPVSAHRSELHDLNQFLCELTFVGRGMLESATQYPELHKEIEGLLPTADKRLRITRAALAALAGDRSAQDETADVLSEVERIFRRHAEATAHRWSPEELELLSSEPQGSSSEFDAWLSA